MFRYRNDSTNQSDLDDFKRPHHCRFLVYGEPLVFFIVQLLTCLICELRLQKTRTRRKRRKGGSLLILMKHPLKWCLDPRKGHPIAEGMYGHDSPFRGLRNQGESSEDQTHGITLITLITIVNARSGILCFSGIRVDQLGPTSRPSAYTILNRPFTSFHKDTGGEIQPICPPTMCPENPSCSLKDLFLIYVWYILLIWFGDGSKWLTTFGGTWWDQIMTEARWFHKFRWALGELLLPPRILLKMMLVFCPWPIIWRIFYEFMLP